MLLISKYSSIFYTNTQNIFELKHVLLLGFIMKYFIFESTFFSTLSVL